MAAANVPEKRALWHELSEASEPREPPHTARATDANAVSTPLELRTLFELHYPSVWRLLRRFGVAPSQLDDAAQEVFWVAARRLAEIQATKERAFLYGVALRVASNVARRRRSAPKFADAAALSGLIDPGPTPDEALALREARTLLDTVLDRMSLELRSVFVLVELEELEVQQVAELEAIPLGTASSRLRRARAEFSAQAKRLRAELSSRRRHR